MAQAPASVQELKAPALPYFVWLEVDGEKVEVYNVEVEDKVVSGYVMAQFGEEVALCYRNEMSSLPYDLCQRGYADGVYFEGKISWTSNQFLSAPAGDSSRVRKLTGARNEMKPLMFVAVAYTPSEELASESEDPRRQKLGIISLKLTYGKAGDQFMNDFSRTSELDNPAPLYGAMDEEEKKAKRVGLGNKKEAEQTTYYKFTENDGGVPFQEFRFYYMGKEALKQKGYLPAAPTRAPSPAHSDTSSLVIIDQSEPESDSELAEQIRTQRKRAQEELDQLRELQTQRKAKKKKVKAEAKVEARAA